MSADQLVGLMLLRKNSGWMSQQDFIASPVGGQVVLDALVTAGLVALTTGALPKALLTAAAEHFV